MMWEVLARCPHMRASPACGGKGLPLGGGDHAAREPGRVARAGARITEHLQRMGLCLRKGTGAPTRDNIASPHMH